MILFYILLLALYRDVPLPHEIKGIGNLMPNVPENAEALVDWALSHIPKSKFSHQVIQIWIIF
jgi:hypothetical protein